ncbi:MAG: 50S ribosomal protein L11 methyltransferase [Oscillospiraceae bacterium]|nr:50S ribosomal protein L11 methyltransferase [Oscillospiraceae bacterium]
MQWLEISVDTAPDRLDRLTGRLSALGTDSLVIEDEATFRAFLEENKKYWDYIDEELEKSLSGLCRVKFYLEDSPEGRKELARLSAALPEYELKSRPVRDEDWENNWKQYYKPVAVGERLLIVPEWEPAPETDRTVLRLDPGLIFGTGTHPTTQMCLRALETLAPGKDILDLGCGSGILAIAALLLGGKTAVGVDIDENAPKVVMANAALNGITGDTLRVFAGDVSEKCTKERLGGKRFGLVLANIVADVIIALAPAVPPLLEKGGVFVCSGIIDGREEETEAALRCAGLAAERHFTQENWHCFLCLPRT